eukprot:7775226-Pyramimonas_sp.AAC.1
MRNTRSGIALARYMCCELRAAIDVVHNICGAIELMRPIEMDGAIYVVQSAWCNIHGTVDVVESMW